jgi:hypothetical protein
MAGLGELLIFNLCYIPIALGINKKLDIDIDYLDGEM